MPVARFAVLALVACGRVKATSSSPRGVAVLPTQSLPTSIEGSVVDNDIYGPRANVTIIAEQHGEERTAITDTSGEYKLTLPKGTYVVSAYYQDATAKPRIVAVREHMSTRVDLELDVAPLAVGREIPECPGAEGQGATDADLDELVVAVLARFVGDPAAGPNWTVIPARGPINLLGEIRESHTPLPIGALARLGRPFVPRSRRELQAAADAAGSHVPYVYFDSIHVDQSCATVEAGVGEMIETKETPAGTCCCAAIDLYQKRSGAWFYIGEFHRHCT